MKAPKFVEFLVKFVPYTYLFRYFCNTNSYIYKLELDFSVDECQYCLNSRTCLNRKHYIMLPCDCIVLASLWLFCVHTKFSTHFKASYSTGHSALSYIYGFENDLLFRVFKVLLKMQDLYKKTNIVKKINFKISKPVEN